VETERLELKRGGFPGVLAPEHVAARTYGRAVAAPSGVWRRGGRVAEVVAKAEGSGRDPGTVRAARAPALVTGFGLGAFIDGILLHQVLQWHHLVVEFRSDATLAGLQENTFWDGIFHFVSWLVVLVGVLWLAARGDEVRAAGLGRFIGMLLVGFGVFNIVDQIIFHLALGAHHIRMVDDYQVYDWSFFGVGVAMVIAGAALTRTKI
jgi:uncharacterized membrane protein